MFKLVKVQHVLMLGGIMIGIKLMSWLGLDWDKPNVKMPVRTELALLPERAKEFYKERVEERPGGIRIDIPDVDQPIIVVEEPDVWHDPRRVGISA